MAIGYDIVVEHFLNRRLWVHCTKRSREGVCPLAKSWQTFSMTLFFVTYHCIQRYQPLLPSTVGTAINLAPTLSLNIGNGFRFQEMGVIRPPKLLAAESARTSSRISCQLLLASSCQNETMMSILMSMMTKARISRSSL